MVRKKIIKAFAVIIGFDIVTSLILLLFLDIPLTQQTLIITGIFSILLAFILDKFGILQKE